MVPKESGFNQSETANATASDGEADMVPKESGFNQSETANATARAGGVIQRQHFCHHGRTICHPKSTYLTTKLYGTSTCRFNNNAIF